MHTKCVIFDWAGTTVDFGSCAPVEVFLKIFEDAHVAVTYEEAREPMGMLKIDHIRAMLHMDRIAQAWEAVYERPANETDVEKLYHQFETTLFDVLSQYARPLEGVIDTVAHLKEMGIRVGSTTGYTREMIEIVAKNAWEKGYAPEFIATADEVGGHGRPAPFMIYENMKQFGVTDIRHVVKVGDTKADILEGKHAGCITIGVIVGSSEMGLTEAEYERLSLDERKELVEKVRHQFLSYGADATIDTMADLPEKLSALGFLPSTLLQK